MPSKSPEQAKLMRAVAHGWQKPGGGPSRAVAQEFVNADRKYSGGFAENRYWTGGLAAMDEVNAGFKGSLRNPFRTFEEGGDVDYRVPGEHGVYEAPNVEEMGPALNQMFDDMASRQKGREEEWIDYAWDKTTSDPEKRTDVDDKLAEMTSPERIDYIKPRLLAAMKKMKDIGESQVFKDYSMADYMDTKHQVHLWRSKWTQALQQQAREAEGEEEGMQRGGRARRNGGGGRRDGGAGTPTTTNVPTVTSYPWGIEAGTTQELRDRMGYDGVMGYLGTVSGLRQAGWTSAPGADPNDLTNTMWYPPEGTLTGVGGPSVTPPRIIPTDPASYVGGTTSGTSGDGGGGSGGSGEGSDYRKQLRKHQNKIAKILGSARGGHVRGYQEGGTARADNPFDPVAQKYQWRSWERKHGRDPDAPEPSEAPPAEPEVAAEEEEGGIAQWIRNMFTPDPETAIGSGEARGTTEEQLEEMGQAYGGRVRYQAGGLAIAAPAGGVPPWISPTGTGPGYMDEPPPGYQFGGIAARYAPPPQAAAAPAAGPAPAVAPPQRGMISRGATGNPAAMAERMRGQMPRGGVMGGPTRLPPGGGAGDRMGALQQAFSAARAGRGGPGGGTMGRLPPGIDPRAVAADPEGWAAHQADPRFADAQSRASGIMDRIGVGGGRFGEEMRRARNQPTYQDYVNSGGGFMPPTPGGGNPNLGRPGYDQIGDMAPISNRPWKQPGRRIAPPPGKDMGESGPFNPGPVGGPRVPPNMRGYLQKQRMMNRPPSNVGGGVNRVGMQDQQGALSRAMQRGTGRPPMSRRSAFGRAQ